MQEIMLSTVDAIRVAQGRPVTVATGDGDVVVRLMTPEEALEAHDRALANLAAKGHSVPNEPFMTYEMAVNITRPLS